MSPNQHKGKAHAQSVHGTTDTAQVIKCNKCKTLVSNNSASWQYHYDNDCYIYDTRISDDAAVFCYDCPHLVFQDVRTLGSHIGQKHRSGNATQQRTNPKTTYSLVYGGMATQASYGHFAASIFMCPACGKVPGESKNRQENLEKHYGICKRGTKEVTTLRAWQATVIDTKLAGLASDSNIDQAALRVVCWKRSFRCNARRADNQRCLARPQQGSQMCTYHLNLQALAARQNPTLY